MFSAKLLAPVFALPLSVFAGEALAPDPGVASRHRVSDAAISAPAVATATKAVALPPLPEGVQELKFADFFKLPVGPLGLELSDKLASLDGQRVRILGYMVREQVDAEDAAHKDAGSPEFVHRRLLLTATPQIVSTAHYGLCDDLPPQTLFVTVPDHADKPVAHTDGLMLLTGTLSLGARVEEDGRTSLVRLALDPRPAVAAAVADTLSDTATASRPAEAGKTKNQTNP